MMELEIELKKASDKLKVDSPDDFTCSAALSFPLAVVLVYIIW
jgi:hypothetical protein